MVAAVQPTTLDSRLSKKVGDAWRAPAEVKSLDWIPANVRMPEETESPGPFDLDTFPNAVGVLEALDDPMIRNIYMPWSARLGKTIIGLAALMHFGNNYPRPSMLARETEERVDDLCGSQFYPLLEACDDLRHQLLPKHKRNKRSIDLARCRIRRAYSGAPSSMAGFPACYALASEVSKWSKKKSTEADPIYLFKKRGMLYPFDSKYIFESTPGEIDACNITTLCSSAGVDVRRRLVPCPHCGTFQELHFGDKKDDSPGVKWDKDKAGRSDPILAEASAWYRCENGCRIENSDRPEMMRAGVWLSVGQRINNKGKISGKPVCPSSTVAFGHPGEHPFSALHSLMISGWGQIAREFLEVQGNREGLREFHNQTLGKVWDPAPVTVKPHELAERLRGDSERGVCPDWTAFLTLAADVGSVGDTLFYYWGVCAWGPVQPLLKQIPSPRGQWVDWGMASGSEAFLKLLATLSYPIAGGGSLGWKIAGVDAGYGGRNSDDHEVYTLCSGVKHLIPIRGSSASLGPDWYNWGFKRADATKAQLRRKKKAGLGDLLYVNTARSQSFRENLITGRVSRDDPDWCGLPFDVCDDWQEHEDFFDELKADHLIDGRWENFDRPNEYGDVLRYNRALAELATRGGKLWGKLPDPHGLKTKKQDHAKHFNQSTKNDRFTFLGPAGMPDLIPGLEKEF